MNFLWEYQNLNNEKNNTYKIYYDRIAELNSDITFATEKKV